MRKKAINNRASLFTSSNGAAFSLSRPICPKLLHEARRAPSSMAAAEEAPSYSIAKSRGRRVDHC